MTGKGAHPLVDGTPRPLRNMSRRPKQRRKFSSSFNLVNLDTHYSRSDTHFEGSCLCDMGRPAVEHTADLDLRAGRQGHDRINSQ